MSKIVTSGWFRWGALIATAVGAYLGGAGWLPGACLVLVICLLEFVNWRAREPVVRQFTRKCASRQCRKPITVVLRGSQVLVPKGVVADWRNILPGGLPALLCPDCAKEVQRQGRNLTAPRLSESPTDFVVIAT